MKKEFAESAYNGGITSHQHLRNVMLATADDCKSVKAGEVNLFGEIVTVEVASDQNARMVSRLADSMREFAQYLGD